MMKYHGVKYDANDPMPMIEEAFRDATFVPYFGDEEPARSKVGEVVLIVFGYALLQTLASVLFYDAGALSDVFGVIFFATFSVLLLINAVAEAVVRVRHEIPRERAQYHLSKAHPDLVRKVVDQNQEAARAERAERSKKILNAA